MKRGLLLIVLQVVACVVIFQYFFSPKGVGYELAIFVCLLNLSVVVAVELNIWLTHLFIKKVSGKASYNSRVGPYRNAYRNVYRFAHRGVYRIVYAIYSFAFVINFEVMAYDFGDWAISENILNTIGIIAGMGWGVFIATIIPCLMLALLGFFLSDVIQRFYVI